MNITDIRPRVIRWHKPIGAELEIPSLDLRDAGTSKAFASHQRQLAILAEIGVPIAEGAETAKEYAIDLLRVAAEVEHALMVQYLYTANSIVVGSSGEENYQRKILNIAIQEMGHFATVQNLLVLLGGPDAVYVQRDVYRANSDKNPIPFILEPLTRTVLAKYVAAEMPAEPPAQLADQVKKLVALAKQDSGIEPHRVGAIYTVLEWLFMDEKDAVRFLNLVALAPELGKYPHLTDADLSTPADIAAYQADKEEWDGAADWPSLLIEPARSRQEAVAAIRLIAEQGEGFEGNEDSHFHEFIEMFDAFEAGKVRTKSIATSPDLGTGHGAERPTLITSSFTKLWGQVFSLQYTLIVLTIQHAIRTPRGTSQDPGLRKEIADLAMRGMRKIVEAVSAILANLPLEDGGAQVAGPPFDLDPADLIVVDPAGLPARQIDLLDKLEPLYIEIQNSAEFGKDPDYRIEVANLRNMDKLRRQLFENQPIPTA
ncbi:MULTISPECIES: ferritin-like domain-containing protein [unclassified Mesorhizobium]|uniref:ferritin-like domain-containing protein n=1 Tax=unclassified Mesorhizobium TaxID=325217 RepID=UPI0003CE5DDA|nr:MULTISPECIES: ferritin-like domain-containing protein [unclassified Mesorhizobium]ESX18038.1 hypothetical protein X765_32405 [Mesorhizobium sp. LSHC440B00]ESX29996.1 hypothetical protein X763_30025 [Mesorhizobium sp. LSHC432A00]ESX31243.1 hypothetical protein X764_30605 [Mesorhizobium sp. LSHC440A00]WJI57238.1 ferritin-like protein [Mesorhizobium sp. C432A]